MKILQINNRVPFPLHDGGNIAVIDCTLGFLNAGAELSLLAMNTSRHYVDLHQLPSFFSRLKNFVVVNVDNSIRFSGALKSLVSGSSYNIDRFISDEFEKALIRLLKENDFDIIQLEGLYVTPYIRTIRRYSKAPVVLRQHNIEFLIWERLAAKERNQLKKGYLKLLASRLKQYEQQHKNDYDLVLPISKKDETLFLEIGNTAPVFLHPFGLDTTAIPYLPGTLQPVTLYHIGAMDWLPNQESVNWLLERVMPALHKKAPHLHLYLAGRNMPDHYFKIQQPNITVSGEVPDAQAFESDKTILVVPLQSGGGVRIKIFQAMAMGKCIVTTQVGAEGIEVKDGIHLFIANDPDTFVNRIIELARHPQRILNTGKTARQLIESRYERETLIQKLLTRYRQLIDQVKSL